MSTPSPSPSMPDWAVERTKALLRSGVAVPQIEQQLMAQGLSPEMATAVVDWVLGARTRQQFLPLQQAERSRFLHRLLSSCVGAACVLLAYWFFGSWPACRTGLRILLPVACIWFPDELGGYVSKHPATVTILGRFIRWGAWLVLLLVGGRVLWLGLALPSN